MRECHSRAGAGGRGRRAAGGGGVVCGVRARRVLVAVLVVHLGGGAVLCRDLQRLRVGADHARVRDVALALQRRVLEAPKRGGRSRGSGVGAQGMPGNSLPPPLGRPAK